MDTNFQPTPKRFMVWSVDLKKFLASKEAHKCMWHDFVKTEPSGKCELQSTAKHIICQSTNLYAGNNEVFEGSLLQTDKEGVGYVYMEDNGKWMVLFKNEVHSLSDLLYAPSCKLVGHILSNPELLEEK